MATLREQILIFAKENRANDEFIERVHTIFTRCGVSLTDDATPYLDQLQETFTREAAIEKNATARAERIAQLNIKIASAARTNARTLEQLDRSVRSLRRNFGILRSSSVNRQQLTLCPGPSEIQ